MIRHVLLLRPRPDSSPQAVEACRAGLVGLVGKIPGLVDCHFGPNFAPVERQDGFSQGFTMDFVDREALAAYGPHPAHAPVAAMVRATFEKIVCFDLAL
jgi:hypothetical protein